MRRKFTPGCPCCSSCNPTDLLIVSCNANLVTDDTYDVYLNGSFLVTVPTQNLGECVSQGTGAWCATNSTITPTSITNVGTLASCSGSVLSGGWTGGGGILFGDGGGGGWLCEACITDNVWTYGTIPWGDVESSNELVLTAVEDAGCADWGVVGVFSLAPSGSSQWKICQTLICSTYNGASGARPVDIFNGTFAWSGAIPDLAGAGSGFDAAFGGGFG